MQALASQKFVETKRPSITEEIEQLNGALDALEQRINHLNERLVSFCSEPKYPSPPKADKDKPSNVYHQLHELHNRIDYLISEVQDLSQRVEV